ncbi:MAG TPA: hypothetical protein VIL13_00795 [Longimicrobiales bacterium]
MTAFLEETDPGPAGRSKYLGGVGPAECCRAAETRVEGFLLVDVEL